MTKADIENLSSKIKAFKKKHDKSENAPTDSSKSGAAKAFQFFIEFVSAVFVAIAIGLFLDNVLSTAPVFLVILTIFGCAAGVLNVYRFAKTLEKGNI